MVMHAYLNISDQRAALEACHKGWGVSTIIGVAPAGAGGRGYMMIYSLLYLLFLIRDLHSSISTGNRSSVEGNSIRR